MCDLARDCVSFSGLTCEKPSLAGEMPRDDKMCFDAGVFVRLLGTPTLVARVAFPNRFTTITNSFTANLLVP